MDAGRLTKRVTLETPTITRGTSFKEPVESWATFATVWAAVEPLSGRELLANRQVENEVSTRIRIRYRAGVLPKMRAKLGARVYRIDAVIDREEAHRELELLCVEVV